jgi:hypothetical protein
MKDAARRVAAAVALAAALGVGMTGLMRGTWAVGGSDSACYGLMADAFAAGRIQPSTPLASEVPWPDGPLTLAPAGFLPSQTRVNAVSPVCAPGFSLLLAPLVWLGGRDGIFLLTPMAGAALVWLAFILGSRLAGPLAGALSALLVATSPIVLFQVVQPMNDVLTAAVWLAVVVAVAGNSPRRVWTAGALTGLALVVRPNLLPAAVVAGLLVPVTSADREDTGSPAHELPVGSAGARGIRTWGLQTAAFAAGALPGILIVAWLNAELYGSPTRSGYGNLGELFALGFVPTNVARYRGWLVETQTLFPLLALAAPFVCTRSRRGVIRLALGVAAATTAVYLLYRPFDAWWYLRFLMPAVVLGLVLASAAAVSLLSRLPWRPALAAGAALAIGLSVFGVRTAETYRAFALRALEQRFRDAGVVARDRLEANAVLLTVWQSGAVRFHADKDAVLWDSLDPDWLDRAVSWLTGRGFKPYILVEGREESDFRARFAGRALLGDLDWPPTYEIDRQVRVFDPAARARYLAGQPVVTEYLWPSGPKTGRAGR